MASVTEAESLADDHVFDLIVTHLPRRGAFSFSQLNSLQQQFPLARLVVVTGPLCEGPWRRNVDVLPGMTLVPWHRWHDWLHTNADRLGHGLPAAWALPRTAGVDEMAEFWSRAAVPSASGLIVIDSLSHDAAEALGETVALSGYSYIWNSHRGDTLVRGATAVVVEANGWEEEIADRIHKAREQHPASPTLLVLNFPLPADVSAAKAAGAASVIGKPFTLSEFLGQLELAISSQPQRVTHAA